MISIINKQHFYSLINLECITYYGHLNIITQLQFNLTNEQPYHLVLKSHLTTLVTAMYQLRIAIQTYSPIIVKDCKSSHVDMKDLVI